MYVKIQIRLFYEYYAEDFGLKRVFHLTGCSLALYCAQGSYEGQVRAFQKSGGPQGAVIAGSVAGGVIG